MANSYSDSVILVWELKMRVVRAPLHFIQLSLRFVPSNFKIAVRSELLVAGIDPILRNDLASGNVPSPEVTEDPIPNVTLLHCEL